MKIEDLIDQIHKNAIAGLCVNLSNPNSTIYYNILNIYVLFPSYLDHIFSVKQFLISANAFLRKCGQKMANQFSMNN